MTAVTTQTLQSQASAGQYYCHVKNGWRSLGKLENFIRYYFSGIPLLNLDSAAQACLRYSWEALTKREQVPEEIEKTIRATFNESLETTNPLNRIAALVGQVFIKTCQEFLTVKTDPYLRVFYCEGFSNVTQIVGTGYGKLDIYNSRKEKICDITHDKLSQTNPAQDLATSACTRTQIDLKEANNTTFSLKPIQPSSNIYVVHKLNNGQGQNTIALAERCLKKVFNSWWHPCWSYSWKITLLEKTDDTLYPLLAFMLVKETQNFLPSPQELRYAKGFQS